MTVRHLAQTTEWKHSQSSSYCWRSQSEVTPLRSTSMRSQFGRGLQGGPARTVVGSWAPPRGHPGLCFVCTADKGTLITVSEPFVTIRALMDKVEGAFATVGSQRWMHCDCLHDLLDHRLHPIDLDQPLLGGMTSCPLCDCARTFSFNHPSLDCDSPTDGGE
jgi:hypothetical protein